MVATVDARVAALDRVLEIAALIQQDQSVSLAPMGLTPRRAHALWVLGSTGPSTHRELAEALGVVPRTVTDLVDALEGLGLVTREPHVDDRRASVITLTDEGRALVRRLHRGRRRFADTLFGDHSAEEVAAFSEATDRVLGTLRALVGPGAA